MPKFVRPLDISKKTDLTYIDGPSSKDWRFRVWLRVIGLHMNLGGQKPDWSGFMGCSFRRIVYILLTLSWQRSLSYTDQYIDFPWKSMYWFLYGRDLHHERVKNYLFKYCTEDRSSDMGRWFLKFCLLFFVNWSNIWLFP